MVFPRESFEGMDDKKGKQKMLFIAGGRWVLSKIICYASVGMRRLNIFVSPKAICYCG